MYHFCTYFDRNYLLRGMALYRSLVAAGCDFKLYILALDDEVVATIGRLALANVQVIPLSEIEAWEPRLAEAKQNRSKVEYYFTLSPILPLFLFDKFADISLVTYLDADLFFYQTPAPIFDEFGDRSVLICDHRYSAHLDRQVAYGRYNVQFQIFRRDTTGYACLNRWRDQCLEWCYDRVEDTRYADQKYLDEWPELYGDKLVVLQHKGGGVAPWNWAAYPMQMQQGRVTIGTDPLIFYHFHGVKIFSPHFISHGLADWGVMPSPYLRWFYANYIRALRETRDWLKAETDAVYLLKDRSIRGKGVQISTLGEIARKAFSQGMVIF
jgi:hypothetical protein